MGFLQQKAPLKHIALGGLISLPKIIVKISLPQAEHWHESYIDGLYI